MRVSIRLQLALLVVLTCLTVLCVIAVAVWINNNRFVINVISSRLALAASLKAAQIASSLQILNSTIQAATSRILIQDALRRYNNDRNNSIGNWQEATPDLLFALDNGRSGLLQAIIWPRNESGPAGLSPLLNATVVLSGDITLPYTYPNGSLVALGDPGLGYPPSLYPNLTASSSAPYPFNTSQFLESKALLLGPLTINDSFALLSISVPIVNNGTTGEYLGYMTVVASAELILDILTSREGLFATGESLLIAPNYFDNRFPTGILSKGGTGGDRAGDTLVRFAVVPQEPSGSSRHESFNDMPFPMRAYQAVQQAYTSTGSALGYSDSIVSTKNEDGNDVSVGFAIPNTNLCQWVLLVEEDKREAYGPITTLRNIILACVFGTLGAIIITVVPIAHYAVTPIRELKEATVLTRRRPGDGPDDERLPDRLILEKPLSKRQRFVGRLRRRRTRTKGSQAGDSENATFRIPSKVKPRKHLIKDELTDLCLTYNDMIDELFVQYETLEDRVKDRTKELEVSKKAAEVANESKTHFIASISHELKTPLNGILGMCSICLSETDMRRIKRSLAIVNESGELLLSLLDDLLTFSKHEVNRQIMLDEKSFRLATIGSQLVSIFQKQAIDAEIDLNVKFERSMNAITNRPTLNLPESSKSVARIEDLQAWGDKNRILQVLINLVSNSLKFTPSGGAVQVHIRCIGEEKPAEDEPESLSRQGSVKAPAPNPASVQAPKSRGTISGLAPPMARSNSNLPQSTKTFVFEFEVQDTGPGISEELHKRIFEPFVQGDPGLSRKFGGTGLGLSICSQLVKLMGGEILLRSTLGLGSTFTVRIPIKVIGDAGDSSNRRSFEEGRFTPKAISLRTGSIHSLHSDENSIKSGHARLVGMRQPYFTTEPPLSPSNPSQQAQQASEGRFGPATEAPPAVSKNGKNGKLSGIRVLVADDNAINQEIVLRMLKMENISDVTLASDGQEAFERAKESMEQLSTFSIIFMDIQMPLVDGIQSTKMIRELGYQAPIVALTAFTEESNIKECLDSGMNHFLPKPIRRQLLSQVLKTYCKPITEENETTSSEPQLSK